MDPKEPFLTGVNRDGKFQISYELSDGRESAFRCDPAFADWVMKSWEKFNAPREDFASE